GACRIAVEFWTWGKCAFAKGIHQKAQACTSGLGAYTVVHLLFDLCQQFHIQVVAAEFGLQHDHTAAHSVQASSQVEVFHRLRRSWFGYQLFKWWVHLRMVHAKPSKSGHMVGSLRALVLGGSVQIRSKVSTR